MNNSLSQEEIDALIKETLEWQKQKQRETQLEFELGYYDQNEKPKEPKKVCFHEWVEYLGLNERFFHCKHCGEKKV